MSAIGNLNDFVKYQMAQGMEKGGTGAAGVGAEIAVGMAVAKDIVNQAGVTAPARTWPEILTPADAAKVLGVSEVDVIASLEAGEMKGKRIGSLWRIMRAQLDQFLQ
jgi:excisionase family DNA binding protein